MAASSDASIAAALDRAIAEYESLAERAEEVDDEWQYIQDLREAYVGSMRALRPADSLEPEATVAAIDELIAEAALIGDPHKAIDWLSTFPHVLALAVGGDVDRAGGPPGTDAGSSDLPGPESEREPDPEPPDPDSPFRFLLRGDR